MPGKTLSVAVIASSGGGTATLGHTDPSSLLETMNEQLWMCGARIEQALFVCLVDGKGMDTVNELSDKAILYQVERHDESSPFSCKAVMEGSLQQVNSFCKMEQKKIAQKIVSEEIHGLVCISCSVDLFSETLQAAAKARIAVTGSGGTSLSRAASRFGIHLVGNAGGSVATTSFTRAVSYTHALAVNWKRSYEPWKQTKQQHVPTFTSILVASLPVFWAVCLANFFLQTPTAHRIVQSCHCESMLEQVLFGLQNVALPSACAVIAATSYCGRSTPSLLMASSLAGTISCSKSVLSGLIAGFLTAFGADRMLYLCIFNNIPATMTNLLTSGGVGILAALVTIPFTPVLRMLTITIRSTLCWTVMGWQDERLSMCAGFIWGCFSCYASKVGWYHSLFLPLILIEMETGQASFLGALDELTLVMVCAGVCLGNIVTHRFRSTASLSESDLALCWRGLRTNLMYGDFVEVCYPFMENSMIINIGGYLASGMSSAFLVSQQGDTPRTLAYLPIAGSVVLAGDAWRRMALASCIALGISFLFTIISNFLTGAKQQERRKMQ